MVKVIPALLAACALLLGTRAGAQVASAGADARASIQAMHARLDSVSRAGDARGNADLFTEDAVVGLSTLQDVRGRDALLRMMTAFYQKYVVQVHELTTAELEVYGDTAYDRGTYLWIVGPREPGGAVTTERGRYAAVWHKGVGGTWRIHRYLENLLPSTSP